MVMLMALEIPCIVLYCDLLLSGAILEHDMLTSLIDIVY